MASLYIGSSWRSSVGEEADRRFTSCHRVTRIHFCIHGSYLEEVFKVRLVVRFALQQGGGVELTRTETDVGLHVREL